jgi:hypothetical protein
MGQWWSLRAGFNYRRRGIIRDDLQRVKLAEVAVARKQNSCHSDRADNCEQSSFARLPLAGNDFFVMERIVNHKAGLKVVLLLFQFPVADYETVQLARGIDNLYGCIVRPAAGAPVTARTRASRN